ncbi:MAG TPA: glycosyltransferase family 4 protein [Stellaceae bacterium]|nr:glycosyltransferase family 4 protein [Stellaceae bacterium]
MRILLVNYEYTLTGSTLLLLRLAGHLHRAGHEVSVYGMVPDPGPVKDAFLRGGFRIVEPLPSGPFDLALCNTLMTAPLVCRLSPAMKTIWWIHEGSIGVDLLLRQPSHVAAFAQASAVVFALPICRDAIYRSFIYHLDPARFVVIPYGVPAIAPGPPRPAEPERIRVISVGSVYPRKRHGDLIRAVGLLTDAPLDCTIVGKFYSLPEDCLRLVAADPGRYRLVGELDNRQALQLVAEADIFCLPSGSELQPLALLEAALLGKPIVLPDLAVYQGLWRHGRNCLVYPLGDVPLLAQAIALLASNPALRRALAAAAQETARPYTDRAFFARFDALLCSL